MTPEERIEIEHLIDLHIAKSNWKKCLEEDVKKTERLSHTFDFCTGVIIGGFVMCLFFLVAQL